MNTGWLGLIAVLLLLPVTGGGDGRGAPLPARAARRETADDHAKAKVRALAISSATEQYYANNDVFPPSLAALTLPQPNGGGPLLKPADIVDPWGKRYQYNPKGPRNGGNKTDVWSVSPLGKVICNWE